jgi:hypothetical protein
MIKPITTAGATSVDVIFPGKNEVSFNLFCLGADFIKKNEI